MNIFDALEHGRSYFPDKEAILFGGDAITYRDLHERACRLSSALKEIADLRQGDRVALFLPNRPEFILSYYAAVRLGAIAVSLNVMLKRDEVKFILNDSEAKILITGHADQRGSEAYNERLARARAETVAGFMMESGITEDRIRIVSRGKLDALASLTDLVGMQKDRNAHFVIAEVEEVMLPYQGPPQEVEAEPIGEDKYLVEEEVEVESAVKVSTREYIVKSGDTLSKIAKEQLGSAHRWVYLYELNKDRIKDPHKLKAGQKIVIPVE